jgi:hypothetical protein
MREPYITCINGVSYRMKIFLILLYFDYMNLLILCFPEDVILLGQLRMALEPLMLLIFLNLMRIQIRLPTIMRIHSDPDPDP